MINFEKVKWKNFLSTGNYFNEVSLDTHNVTVVSGKNGHGKCVFINTIVKVRNKHTGKIEELTIGELYERSKKQEKPSD